MPAQINDRSQDIHHFRVSKLLLATTAFMWLLVTGLAICDTAIYYLQVPQYSTAPNDPFKALQAVTYGQALCTRLSVRPRFCVLRVAVSITDQSN